MRIARGTRKNTAVSPQPSVSPTENQKDKESARYLVLLFAKKGFPEKKITF